MRNKSFVAAVVMFVIMIAGCSTLENVVYRPDISQGNYLVASDVAKIHTGMTKQQVAYLLGTPMVRDSFGNNIWYYIYREHPSHGSLTQQTLTLTFDKNDTLSGIDNKKRLSAS